MSQQTHPSGFSYIDVKNVSQSFQLASTKVELFSGLNMTIEQGQSYAITGPSGAGKSSLLMLMSGLEQPAHGAVVVVKEKQKIAIEKARQQIGFIFQQFHLLPELDALNNVALPLKLRGERNALDKAEHYLQKVGLGHRLGHRSTQLSGGEQQRVAIARALVFEPQFIFADEPTGNLDPQSANDVADVLFETCLGQSTGLVTVTHSESLAQRAQHIYRLEQGNCVLTRNKETTSLSSLEVSNAI